MVTNIAGIKDKPQNITAPSCPPAAAAALAHEVRPARVMAGPDAIGTGASAASLLLAAVISPKQIQLGKIVHLARRCGSRRVSRPAQAKFASHAPAFSPSTQDDQPGLMKRDRHRVPKIVAHPARNEAPQLESRFCSVEFRVCVSRIGPHRSCQMSTIRPCIWWPTTSKPVVSGAKPSMTIPTGNGYPRPFNRAI
jgi:hypothetical protein